MAILDLAACSYVGGVTYEGARLVLKPGSACSIRFDDEGVTLYDAEGALYIWDWVELTSIEVRGDDVERSGKGLLGRKGRGEAAARCWLNVGLVDGRVAEIEVPQPPSEVRSAVDAHLDALAEAPPEADVEADVDAGPAAEEPSELPAPAAEPEVAPVPPTPGDVRGSGVAFVGVVAPGPAGEALAAGLAEELTDVVVTHVRWFGDGGLAAAVAASTALAVGGRPLVVVGLDDRDAAVAALASTGLDRPVRWLDAARFDPPQVVAWVRAQGSRTP